MMIRLTRHGQKHIVNRDFSCSPGWSDRHVFRGNEVGSPPSLPLQPSFVFCPRPKLIVTSCTTSALPTTSVHRRGERNGEAQSEPRFHAPFTPRLWVSSRGDRPFRPR